MANINLDFTKKVVIETTQQPWINSPMAGVKRKPLARSEDEVHITSIVEYAAGSYLSEHTHPQGEEIFVLEGTFSDQDGDYPAGLIFSIHPIVAILLLVNKGLILVKLNQFINTDLTPVRLNTNKTE